MTEGSTTRPIVLVGVGNDHRSDDAVGLVVARRIAAAGIPGLVVRTVCGDATAVMEAWSGAEAAILVDAVAPAAGPGSIVRIDAASEPLPIGLSASSTHAFGVTEAVELARALGELPHRLVVFGVEARDVSMGTQLSPEVAGAVDDACARVVDEVSRLRGAG
jgi:hydrogenase maturation protease